MTAAIQRSQYVQEDDPFLRLFPHRFDFIQAPFPNPGDKARWRTVSYHPLSDRLLLQGGALFGVRFNRETSYLMIDVDVDSPYHPNQDDFALGKLRASLELVGLQAGIPLTSSASGGLHVYFPFPKPINSYKVADAVTALLQSKGFKIASGQLEIFPNTKNYSVCGSPSLFNAHRLPLQEPASQLLNDDLEPIFSSHKIFVSLWQHCAAHNDITAKTIARIRRTKKRKRRLMSVSANEFLEDLNADINPGWSSHHQSNFIFGRIVMREFIFHHVTTGGDPLTGNNLIQHCIAVAQSLPGFKTFCRHQHELAKRITDWVKAIENSHYFPYGQQKGKYKPVNPIAKTTAPSPKESWNQEQVRRAQAKITQAVSQLKADQIWPQGVTARFKLLKQQGCGSSTLYRHLHLWHPEHEEQERVAVEADTTKPEKEMRENESNYRDVPVRLERADGHNHTSLLQTIGRNPLSQEDFIDSSGDATTEYDGNPVEEISEQVSLPFAAQALRQAPAQTQHPSMAEEVARYLWSDDPILVAEGVQTLLYQPALLAHWSVAEAVEHAAAVDEVSVLLHLFRFWVRAKWTIEHIHEDLYARFAVPGIAALSQEQLLLWIDALSLL